MKNYLEEGLTIEFEKRKIVQLAKWKTEAVCLSHIKK
jgi:hypothetical protein